MAWRVFFTVFFVLFSGCLGGGDIGESFDPLVRCSNISKKIDRDECVRSAAFDFINSSLCSRISADSLHYGGCFVDVIGRIKDARGCAEIDDPYYERMCYSTVAEYTGDARVCDMIEGERYSQLRNYCVIKVARISGDESLCTALEDRLVCLALSRRDKILCEDIENEAARVDCLFAVSSLIKDTSICEQTDLYLGKKEDCIENILKSGKYLSKSLSKAGR